MNAISPIEAQPLGPISVTWEGERAPFAKAFVAAQKATESIKKAATNPAFKSRYADLAHVVEGVIPALNEAGIGVMQFPVFDGELVSVSTTFLHESGAAVTGVLHLRPSKSDPQGVGSAITYARRYSLLAMTGAAPEDDDANAASGPRQRPPSAEDAAINMLRGAAADRELFKEAWAKNRDGWKNVLDGPAYARVVKVMQEIAAKFPKDAPAPTPPADDLGIGDDEIPF